MTQKSGGYGAKIGQHVLCTPILIYAVAVCTEIPYYLLPVVLRKLITWYLLTHSHTMTSFDAPGKKSIENTVVKGKFARNE